jgi:outer membrane usher protein
VEGLRRVQLSRDFSLRPDIVTYPVPQLAAQSAVPGALDLFVNGEQTSRNEVGAGPCVINNVPFVNGAGEAVIVVTAALGRQVSTKVPFYVSSDMLKSG